MSKLNFAKVIWWWQFGCKDGWTPDSIRTLGWELKIKSIHEEELFKVCVGSLIFWSKRFCEIIASVFLPSSTVISLLYQLLELVVKSPRATNKEWFFWAIVSKVNSKLSRKIISSYKIQNHRKSSYDWLGDLWGKWNCIICHQFVTRKVYFREEIWYQGLLMIDSFYNAYLHLHVYC